ncbi:hypothetical protein [Nocardioides sp. SR21]|uniref:hypothetical protein n=1 Tax=Nocardioides sp. SR21 TaxID=2919501 RepID=UPI001FAA005F|nr:hypothetical protein [Nocardioides sp. SR21]
MIGPLPRLHRLLVVAVALIVAIASGAWVAHFSPLPVAAVAGAMWGFFAGIVLAYVLVHDFHAHPHPVRLRRH